MSKIIKFSKLNKKFNLINLKKHNIILLDEYTFNNIDLKKDIHEKTIIIGENLVKDNIDIICTKASNIYFENYDNLGDITIPYEFNKGLYISFEGRSKVKKINILNDKNIVLDLDDNIKSIRFIKGIKLEIYINYMNRDIGYVVDKNGYILETKEDYRITSSDKCDNNLNLCNLSDYKSLSFDNLYVDTLIINKYYLENIDKLYSFSRHSAINFHNCIRYQDIKIIDDNDMKLKQEEILLYGANYLNTSFINNKEYKYIYSKIKNNKTLVFLDKNNNIKFISELELLKDKNVKRVYFEFGYRGLFKKNPELIIIKYKDYYKVIDFDEFYIVDSLFFKLLLKLANKYNSETTFVDTLNNQDLIALFETFNISKKTFLEMYNDYINYKKYIEKLKELGFTNSSIKYLFDKKIESIIKPNEENLNNISETEIRCFNEIGYDYVKKKRLNKNNL